MRQFRDMICPNVRHRCDVIYPNIVRGRRGRKMGGGGIHAMSSRWWGSETEKHHVGAEALVIGDRVG